LAGLHTCSGRIRTSCYPAVRTQPFVDGTSGLISRSSAPTEPIDLAVSRSRSRRSPTAVQPRWTTLPPVIGAYRSRRGRSRQDSDITATGGETAARTGVCWMPQSRRSEEQPQSARYADPTGRTRASLQRRTASWGPV